MMMKDSSFKSANEVDESTRFLELRARVQNKALEMELLFVAKVESEGRSWRFVAGGELMRWAVNAAAKTLSVSHENPKAFLKSALSKRSAHQAFAYLSHFIEEESYERIESWLDGKIAARNAERAALRESEGVSESSGHHGVGEAEPVASAVD